MTSPKRFETLIELYHDELFSYLWRMVNSAGRADGAIEAQDLAQEVFFRAFRAFGRLRPDSNHRAWLYKIATNCAYSALQRDQRESRHRGPTLDEFHNILSDERQSPGNRVVINETLEAIQHSVAALPTKQRAAVVLRHVQGLTYPEIAQALDCTEQSARANVYQALRRLRRELGEDQNPSQDAGVQGSND